MTTATKMKLAGRGIRGIAGTGYVAGRLLERAKASARALRRSAELTKAQAHAIPLAATAAGAAALGAASAYYLDRENGRRRRHGTRDKLLKHAGSAVASARRETEYAGGAAAEGVKATTPSPRDPAHDLNDSAPAARSSR